MKVSRYIYSREWDTEDYDPTLVARDPAILDLREVCIPLPECATVSLRAVDSSAIQWLEHNGFDQAPVEVPSAEIGWRLVAADRLKTLLMEGRPLTSDDLNFNPNDTVCFARLESWVPLEELLEAMTTRASAIVFCQTEGTVLDADGNREPLLSQTIYGLITRADLNRQAVRAAVYDRLCRLEIALAQFVGNAFTDPWDWIQKLGEEGQVRILGYSDLSKRRNIELNPVAAATLVELMTVVARSPELLGRLEYPSRKKYEDATGKIAKTRNCVMHPVRPLILGPEDVTDLGIVLRTVIDLQRRVEVALHNQSREFMS